MKRIKIIPIIILLIFSTCKSGEKNNVEKINLGEQTSIDKESFIPGDSAVIIADSIMYITDVKNANPTEAYYMDEWLSGAKIEILANQIFKAIYDKKLPAYDYLSGNEMTIEEVKNLETEWKRDNIGQILFTEDWYFDPVQMKMYKQVNSLMLAYFRYDSEGNISGNKSGVRVYFNGTKPMKGAIDY